MSKLCHEEFGTGSGWQLDFLHIFCTELRSVFRLLANAQQSCYFSSFSMRLWLYVSQVFQGLVQRCIPTAWCSYTKVQGGDICFCWRAGFDLKSFSTRFAFRQTLPQLWRLFNRGFRFAIKLLVVRHPESSRHMHSVSLLNHGNLLLPQSCSGPLRGVPLYLASHAHSHKGHIVREYSMLCKCSRNISVFSST